MRNIAFLLVVHVIAGFSFAICKNRCDKRIYILECSFHESEMWYHDTFRRQHERWERLQKENQQLRFMLGVSETRGETNFIKETRNE